MISKNQKDLCSFYIILKDMLGKKLAGQYCIVYEHFKYFLVRGPRGKDENVFNERLDLFERGKTKNPANTHKTKPCCLKG